MKQLLLTLLAASAVYLAGPAPTCRAQLAEAPTELIKIQRPAEREFVLDQAKLLTVEDKKHIQDLCDKLLTDKATPIIVVTIDSMAQHGGAGMTIESFATLLFNQWQLGVKEVNKQSWNTGILLLVSKNDRKARIELGAYWRRDQDELAKKIMNEQIIPQFKAGNFSAGILAGVESLDKMARDLPQPKAVAPPAPWWQLPLMIGVGVLAIASAISLFRRGSSGWAWLLWGAVFGAIGYMLYQMATNRGGSGSSGYSGGSFGGGFSGGGGATGSW
jgi:uncharacterized protein